MKSFVVGLLLVIVWAPDLIAKEAGCDRECLRGLITAYLNGLVAKNPAAIPVASTIKFTEDSVQMKLGEGLWKTATALRKHRQDILDVRQSIAASYVVVEEGGSPVLLLLRLKAVDGKIAEVETMAVRNKKEGVLFNPDALVQPSAAMEAKPAPSEMASRSETVRIAEFYPAGLKIGSFITVDVPFAPDAYRVENGVVTAGPTCKLRPGCENIKTQKIIAHPGLTHRVIAVDEDLGLVLMRINFGETDSYPAGQALFVWETFKVYGNQIHAVEAYMEMMPSRTPSGWEN